MKEIKELFALEDIRTKRLIGFGTSTNVLYFENKMKAKEMRAKLHKEEGMDEKTHWLDGKQVVPYRYVIRRGPDHYRGSTRS